MPTRTDFRPDFDEFMPITARRSRHHQLSLGRRYDMAGWRVDADVQPDNTVHVWPDGEDLVGHDLTAASRCVCGPFLEEQVNGNVMVVHHSLDGRELTEPDHG